MRMSHLLKKNSLSRLKVTIRLRKKSLLKLMRSPNKFLLQRRKSLLNSSMISLRFRKRESKRSNQLIKKKLVLMLMRVRQHRMLIFQSLMNNQQMRSPLSRKIRMSRKKMSLSFRIMLRPSLKKSRKGLSLMDTNMLKHLNQELMQRSSCKKPSKSKPI